MSTRKTTPLLQAVTANRLADGAVVYLDPHGAWNTDFRALRVARDEAGAADLLAAAERAVAAARIVAPYLIAVVEGGDGPRPASLRERIRAEGPSRPVADAIALAFP